MWTKGAKIKWRQYTEFLSLLLVLLKALNTGKGTDFKVVCN